LCEADIDITEQLIKHKNDPAAVAFFMQQRLVLQEIERDADICTTKEMEQKLRVQLDKLLKSTLRHVTTERANKMEEQAVKTQMRIEVVNQTNQGLDVIQQSSLAETLPEPPMSRLVVTDDDESLHASLA
jgi:hypothetical protein